MSTPAFAQINPTPWPSGHGDAIAVTRVRPELFSRAFGLSFFEGSDNLDAYEAAAIRLGSGRIVGLMRHQSNPGSGTEIHADAGDDFVDTLREFLDAFDLSVEDLSWIHRDVPAESLHGARERAHA
jgi:hypothetical protein